MEKMSNCAYKITHLENSFCSERKTRPREQEGVGKGGFPYVRRLLHNHHRTNTPSHIICYEIFPSVLLALRIFFYIFTRWALFVSVLVWKSCSGGVHKHTWTKHKINCYIFPFSIFLSLSQKILYTKQCCWGEKKEASAMAHYQQ